MSNIRRAVAGKVMRLLFVVAKKEIGYTWKSSKIVKKFKIEAGKLQVMRGRLRKLLDIHKGDKLLYEVEDWLKEADTKISKAGQFLKQEANAKKTCRRIGFFGNWGTLHRYGKSAAKMARSLRQLRKQGSNYENCLCVETPAPGPLDAFQNKYLDDLHTHNLALGDIIKSLEDESTQITGIYGLGGVGKTTLAMQVVASVKNKLFDVVAFTTVSQNVDVKRIKKDIGEARKRIMKGDKILIILDDVYRKLNLKKLHIPCGNNYMNCKILLVSRSERVCQEMNAQSIICVNSLPTEEAWILFKHVVGKRLEADSNLKLVALKVVEECGGLPLLIQAVGNALKDESINSWESALTELQHVPLDMDEEIRKSYTHLKLSYDYLKSEEAKSCFLLCSMFPKDISLEDLLHYGVGLEKFENMDSIEDARNRVHNAVYILTFSGLLLDSKRKGFTKMHNVVRDVALLIASQCNNKLLVKSRQGLTQWRPRKTSLESYEYKGIALMENNISRLPYYKVNVPNLEIFLVFGNRISWTSIDFIGCMRNVKVLDISRNRISFLPHSFKLITRLRMLNLSGNESLNEITILGELKDLEILILNKTGITKIPKEIAQLVNLRVLHVKYCNGLSRITQGVIPALLRLEEVRIEFQLKFKGAPDCIVELMSLPKLTYLDLTVPSIDEIPPQGQGLSCRNLKEFVIQIGRYNRNASAISSISWSGCYLVLSFVHFGNSLVKRLNKMIEGSSPIAILSNIENLNDIMPTLYDEGFNKLEHIELNDCPNVSCLVDDGTRWDGDEGKTEKKFFKELKTLILRDLNKLEVLCRCPYEYLSLSNLVALSIYSCNKLQRVFSVSVAQSLVNLNELNIESCKDLEEVIWSYDGGDDESENIIVFSSLSVISFFNLWRLKSFYSGSQNCCIKYPSLVDVKIRLCVSMKLWGPGIHETPNLKTLVVNRHNVEGLVDGPNVINDAIAKA